MVASVDDLGARGRDIVELDAKGASQKTARTRVEAFAPPLRQQIIE